MITKEEYLEAPLAKLNEAIKELGHAQEWVEVCKKELEQSVAFYEKMSNYVPKFEPGDREDETPDTDNPFQGREDDAQVTKYLD